MPDLKAEVSVDFEVFCGLCNAGLCLNTNTRLSRNRLMPQIIIEPCEKCLKEKYDEGYEQGKTDSPDLYFSFLTPEQ